MNLFGKGKEYNNTDTKNNLERPKIGKGQGGRVFEVLWVRNGSRFPEKL